MLIMNRLSYLDVVSTEFITKRILVKVSAVTIRIITLQGVAWQVIVRVLIVILS
jgi:hypothetical protein